MIARNWTSCSLRTLSALIAVLLGCVAPRPAAAITQVADPQTFCPLEVRYALPLSASSGATIAFGLGTFGDTAKASGVLTLYAGDDRYDVPFENRVVAGFLQAADAADPIVIRLPDGVVPDAAYVSALTGAAPENCPLGFIWKAKRPTSAPGLDFSRSFDEAKARAKVAGTTPVSATSIAHEDPPACETPYSEARTIVAAPPDYPYMSRAANAQGVVGVSVLLAPSGRVVAAQLIHSAGDLGLDRAAQQAARNSTYAAERFRCRNAFGIYNFRAEFTQGWSR